MLRIDNYTIQNFIRCLGAASSSAGGTYLAHKHSLSHERTITYPRRYQYSRCSLYHWGMWGSSCWCPVLANAAHSPPKSGSQCVPSSKTGLDFAAYCEGHQRPSHSINRCRWRRRKAFRFNDRSSAAPSAYGARQYSPKTAIVAGACARSAGHILGQSGPFIRDLVSLNTFYL